MDLENGMLAATDDPPDKRRSVSALTPAEVLEELCETKLTRGDYDTLREVLLNRREDEFQD